MNHPSSEKNNWDHLTTCYSARATDTHQRNFPRESKHIEACDAAKVGMGSVWFTHDGRSLLWRKPFPADVRDQVVSMKNPQGQVTNSDLELAGTPVHQQMLGNMHTCKVKQCTRCVTTCPWLLGLTRDPPQLPSAMPTCCYKLRLSNRPNKLATTESVTYPVTTTAWHMMPADSGTLTTKHYSPILTVCTSRSTCGSFACRMSS